MLYSYELALLLSAKLAEEKQKKVLDEVKKYITSVSGKADEAKLLGKKKLAYSIKKETEGFYYIIKFTVEGKESAPINKKLALNVDVLRYLVIRNQ
ncbi:30S ribosomal protein S6 [Candidatus Gottesmanbacteria bacterium]|nr:30S ribosomal protein S6 [Candidatus Gottesmanbacteria bacterium]